MFDLFLFVVVESFMAYEHAFVETGCMEEVEVVVSPDGETYMACVKSVTVGEHGYDVS